MAILDIVYFPSKILREKSKKIINIDEKIKQLSLDMIETMLEHKGVGLAAIQVGEPLRMFVIDMHADKEELSPNPLVIINPVVTHQSATLRSYTEGCLSIPEMYEEVQRPEAVKLKYQTIENKIEEMHLTGLLAVCVQHEIDHLDGVLFFDYLSKLKKDRFINKFSKKQN